MEKHKAKSGNEILKGVIYARYSSHNQRDVSIEQQVKECQKYAKEIGIIITDIYADRAKTGKNDSRPQFQKMMKAAERGEFNAVVCWKSDRLGRNMLQAMVNENRLASFGIRCKYVEENFGETAAGRFAARSMMNVNQFYIENLAENVRRGLADNASKCMVTNGLLPFGYKAEDKQFAIDEEKANIVREIFERVAEGEAYMSIARSLNARGIKTRLGREWGRSSFHVMLSNERYRGIYIYDDTRIEGGIPRIIDDNLFFKVQEVVDMRKSGVGSRRAGTDYLLTGKLFCGKCGALMTGIAGTSHTGKIHHYYTCIKKRNEKTCDKQNVTKDEIEYAVAEAIKRYALRDDILENIADMVVEFQKKQEESNDIQIITTELEDTNRAIRNMVKAIETGIVTESTKERLLELEAERLRLERELRVAEASVRTISKETVLDGLKYFREVDYNDKKALQNLFDTFLVAVYVFDDKLKICFSFSEDKNSIRISLNDIKSAGLKGSSKLAYAPPRKKHLFGCFFQLNRFAGEEIDLCYHLKVWKIKVYLRKSIYNIKKRKGGNLMNKNLKTIISVFLTFSLLFVMSVFAVSYAEEGFIANFLTDENCSITTYQTSDYSSSFSENQISAVARDSATGEPDTSGNGQINFTVVPAYGYAVDSVEVEGSYKNLKGPSDTGKENTYRITKVTGDLTVTVKTKVASSVPQYSETALIEFTSDNVTVTPVCSNVTVDQTNVTITQEGTYTISGSCDEGSLTVSKNAGNVTLVLDELYLQSSLTAPISAKSGTTVTVKANGTNILTDADRGAVSPKSCINSSGNLIFGGTGILNVNGNNKNGIKSDGDLTINDLTLNVTAIDNAIASDNVLTILGGNITAKSIGGDCIKADPDAITETTAGNIIINNAMLSLEAVAGDGIQALGTVTVDGGKISVLTGGGYKTATNDELSTKGIKGDSGIIINDGTFNIDSCDDAVHSNCDVTINGGTFTISTGDDAVHSDALLTLKNAEINVLASYEALEGKDIAIESGKYILVSSDDGINAVGTKTETENVFGKPGMPGGAGGPQSGDAILTINGGYIYIKADGDGIDSNGNVVMNDGTVLVVGSSNGGDGALDYDADFKMNGGTVIAIGQSNMAQSVSTDSLGVLNIKPRNKVSSNTLVYLNDENGNTVFAFKLNRAYDSIIIASDKLEIGKTYTLYTGGTVIGESENGFYLSDVVCSGGTLSATATAGSTSNTGGSVLRSLLNRLIEFFRKILSFLTYGKNSFAL